VFGGGAVAAMVVESRIRGSMLACDQVEDERESMRSSCSGCPHSPYVRAREGRESNGWGGSRGKERE